MYKVTKYQAVHHEIISMRNSCVGANQCGKIDKFCELSVKNYTADFIREICAVGSV